MTTAWRWAIVPLALAVAAGAGGEARAQPAPSREAARGRYREAQRLMEAQRWGEARELLREVVGAVASASVLFSIALCDENLGLWREAIEGYRAALARANDPTLDPGLKPAVRRLLQKESRQSIEALGERVPVVRVERLPEGDAAVSYELDGRPVGPVELRQGVRVDPGEHRLSAAAAGQRPLAIVVRAEERDRIVVAFAGRFEPLAPAARAAPPPSRPAEARAGAWRAPAGWAGVGLGAALVGAGVVASLRVDGLDRTPRNDPALRPWPYVFYGAGALVAGAGAYLLLAPGPGGARGGGAGGAVRAWALPGLGPAPLGGSVGGVF